MQKVIRDNKVAILTSSGYGAGWYTWNTSHPELIFHPKLVEMVEQGRHKEIDEDWVEEHLGIKDVYTGGAKDLEIKWLEVGTPFAIEEYDGSERLSTDFLIA